MICWTIEAALNSKHISQILISTDDSEIAEVCSDYNVEIPFLRPSHLATDDALAVDVYNYTMERLAREKIYTQDEYAVLLPTVPFRDADDINNAIDLFEKSQADSVISCKEVEFPMSWVFSLTEESKILFDERFKHLRMLNRQDQVGAYVPNGAIYLLRHNLVMASKSYYSENSLGFLMPNKKSVDIDTIDDFMYAEFLSKYSSSL